MGGYWREARLVNFAVYASLYWTSEMQFMHFSGSTSRQTPPAHPHAEPDRQVEGKRSDRRGSAGLEMDALKKGFTPFTLAPTIRRLN